MGGKGSGRKLKINLNPTQETTSEISRSESILSIDTSDNKTSEKSRFCLFLLISFY